MACALRPWLLAELYARAEPPINTFCGLSMPPISPIADFEDDGSTIRIQFAADAQPLQIIRIDPNGSDDSDESIPHGSTFFLSDSEFRIRAVIPKKVAERYERRTGHRVTQDTRGALIYLKRFEIVVCHYGSPRSRHFWLYIWDFKIFGCEGEGTFGRPQPLEDHASIQSLVERLRRKRRPNSNRSSKPSQSPQTPMQRSSSGEDGPSTREFSTQTGRILQMDKGLSEATTIKPGPAIGAIETSRIKDRLGAFVELDNQRLGPIHQRKVHNKAAGKGNTLEALKALLGRTDQPEQPEITEKKDSGEENVHITEANLENKIEIPAEVTQFQATAGKTDLLESGVGTTCAAATNRIDQAAPDSAVRLQSEHPANTKVVSEDNAEGITAETSIDLAKDIDLACASNNDDSKTFVQSADDIWANLRLTRKETTVPKRQRDLFEHNGDDCLVPPIAGKRAPIMSMPLKDLNEFTRQVESTAARAASRKNATDAVSSVSREDNDADDEVEKEDEDGQDVESLPPHPEHTEIRDPPSRDSPEEVFPSESGWPSSSPYHGKQLPPDTDEEEEMDAPIHSTSFEGKATAVATGTSRRVSFEESQNGRQDVQDLIEVRNTDNELETNAKYAELSPEGVQADSGSMHNAYVTKTTAPNDISPDLHMQDEFIELSEFNSDSELELAIPIALSPGIGEMRVAEYQSTPESAEAIQSPAVQVERTPYSLTHKALKPAAPKVREGGIVQGPYSGSSGNLPGATTHGNAIGGGSQMAAAAVKVTQASPNSSIGKHSEHPSSGERRAKHKLNEVDAAKSRGKKRLRTNLREGVYIDLDVVEDIPDPAPRAKQDRRAFHAQCRQGRQISAPIADYSGQVSPEETMQNVEEYPARDHSPEIPVSGSVQMSETALTLPASPELPIGGKSEQIQAAAASPLPREESPPITEEDDGTVVFNHFKATYPAYQGSQAHFVNMIRRIQRLSGQGRQPHRSMWDDFIIRFTLEYKKYVNACNEEGGDPMPYERFYQDEIEDPIYTKRIITPHNIGLIVPEGVPSSSSSPPAKAPTASPTRHVKPTPLHSPFHSSPPVSNQPPSAGSRGRSARPQFEQQSTPKSSPRLLPWQQEQRTYLASDHAAALSAAATPSHTRSSAPNVHPAMSSSRVQKSPHTPRSVLSYHTAAAIAARANSLALKAPSGSNVGDATLSASWTVSPLARKFAATAAASSSVSANAVSAAPLSTGNISSIGHKTSTEAKKRKPGPLSSKNASLRKMKNTFKAFAKKA